MNTLPSKRIALCVLSGIGVGLIQDTEVTVEILGEGVLWYGISGLVFAAGVLFPCLERGDRVLLRAIALAIASGVSYYCAVWLALDAPFSNPHNWLAFTIASVAGAAIVLLALVLATRVPASRRFALFGLAAGLIGGPITYMTLPETRTLVLTGHASWHILICLAIIFGTRIDGRAD